MILTQALEQARRGGRRSHAYVYSDGLAKVERTLGRHPAAEAILGENIAFGIETPHLPFELHSRQELALLYAQTHRPELAQPHLERCREAMVAGADWRGLAGHVARAEGAAVAAAQGRFVAAKEGFAAAVEIHRRYQVLERVQEGRFRAHSPATIAHRQTHEAQAPETAKRRIVQSVSEPIEAVAISGVFRQQGEY